MELLVTFLLSLVGLVLLLIFLARRDANYYGTYCLALVIFRGLTMYENNLEMYNRTKRNHQKIAGIDFGVKTTVVTDPELIKHIVVKDFDHFVDRKAINFPKADKIF